MTEEKKIKLNKRLARIKKREQIANEQFIRKIDPFPIQPIQHPTHLVWRYIIQKEMDQNTDPPRLKAYGMRIPKMCSVKKFDEPFLRNQRLKIASYVCSAEIEKRNFCRKMPITPI